MHKLTVFAVLALVLLPCIASAQFYGAGAWWQEEEEDTNAVRLRAGWADVGDFGDGLGLGLDYRFQAFNTTWALSGDWVDGSRPSGESAVTAAQSSSGSDVWSAFFNWVGSSRQDKVNLYYGAGAGWTWLNNGGSDDGFSYQVLVGADLNKNVSVDARYVWANDFSGSYNADGFRFYVGYWFK